MEQIYPFAIIAALFAGAIAYRILLHILNKPRMSERARRNLANNQRTEDPSEETLKKIRHKR